MRLREEEKNDREWIILDMFLHLCRNKTQWNALKTVEQYRVGGKGWGRIIEGLDWLKYNIITEKIPRQNPTEQWTGT
jgi:hypothetical protein